MEDFFLKDPEVCSFANELNTCSKVVSVALNSLIARVFDRVWMNPKTNPIDLLLGFFNVICRVLPVKSWRVGWPKSLAKEIAIYIIFCMEFTAFFAPLNSIDP